MALGIHLMTSLREVEKGERIFREAFAAAKDDEERAEVRWYQAAALFEREDRDDEAYYKALETLAKEFPATSWGGIARDRIAAAEHAAGKPPVPLKLATTDGRTIDFPKDLLGKVVILDFWASWSQHAETVERFLHELHRKHADAGLQILGISLDDTRAEFDAFVQREKLPWPQVFEGRGWMSPTALRYNVSAIPNLMVIDKKGRIAGLNLLATLEGDQKRVAALIEAELAKE
jgi:peroxiredoxin